MIGAQKRKLTEAGSSTGDESRRATILRERELLPVILNSKQLVSELEKHRCVILVGETGSGKTTQLPRLIWEGVLGKVSSPNFHWILKKHSARFCKHQLVCTTPDRPALLCSGGCCSLHTAETSSCHECSTPCGGRDGIRARGLRGLLSSL